jgi:hypothetical protein
VSEGGGGGVGHVRGWQATSDGVLAAAVS